MEPNRKYFLVGLFIIITVVAAALFSIWIVGIHKSDTHLYRIRFAESVSGLSVGGAVKYRGVDVGTVAEITIDPVDTRFVRVDVRIKKGTPVKTDTVASLKLQGVTGVVFVELTGGSPNALDLLKTVKDDQIPEIPAEQSSINAIVNQLPELLNKASQIADRINALLSDDTIASFNHTIKHLESISESLDQDTIVLDQLLVNSNATMADWRKITADSRQPIHDMMQNLLQSSEQLDATLVDLRKTSRNVSALSDSLKDDPSRILFPGKPKGIPAP